MTDLVRLLAVLGRINPAIWDALIPHGPILAHGSAFGPRPEPWRNAGSEVELNPQPLPPRYQLLLASAGVAQDIAFAAISSEAGGSDAAARIVKSAIDDWCGTPHPGRPIPWPRHWPFPWPPEPEPPHPDWDINASRVIGALAFAAVASRLAEGAARTALSEGAEQLMGVGLAK